MSSLPAHEVHAARRPSRWLSWGITTRLSIAFAAVAVLAAAVNLIVERGVTVVRTSQLRHEAAGGAARAAPPREFAIEQTRSLHANALNRAIATFSAAAQSHAASNTGTGALDLSGAARELDRAAADFQRDARADPGSMAAALPAHLARYRNDVSEFLQLSDARQGVIAQYSRHYDALSTRLQSSVAGSFTLFGRVLARQVVLQIHADLDEVGRTYAAVRATDGADPLALSSLLAAQAALAHRIDANSTHLRRSQGAAWLDDTQQDLAQLISQSNALRSLDLRHRELIGRLLQEQTLLTELIATRPPRDEVAGANPRGALPLPSASAVAATGASMARRPTIAPEATVATVTTTTEALRDPHDRLLVAWMTGLVLLILLVICVMTIRSIVLPVRRMLRATARLACGDIDARVPRGGIKELDTLAIAFNHMAEQVAAARTLAGEYQRQLEDKVEQRTRELQHLAEHDPLTLLPNRRQLLARLNDTIIDAAAESLHVCVYFIDIDNFKNINDSMGHAFGDQVLRSVAQRLQACAAGIGFAARWGGDEFTVVHQQAPAPDAVQERGRQLVEAFHDPISVAGRELVVTISVGASLFPEHAISGEDLLIASDAALFRAKALGRNRLALFAPELLVSATNRFTTEQSLRRALERSEFELHFQPELNLESLTIDLVEALIRWRQPDGRLAPPDEFLQIAEDSGLILELGDWVLREAIRTASIWHHGAWPEVRMAINVSPRQLLTRGFAARVLALLQEFGLPPSSIELELTESVLQNGPAIVDAMRELQSSGIAIALDDFGTGYSSLASLEHLPLNRIKLDRSLISNIDSAGRSSAIAGAIIDLCAELALEVTAEGIERPQQLACLLGHRRMHLQGYLISHAVPGALVLAQRESIFLRMQEIMMPVRAGNAALESSDSAQFDRTRRKRSKL